MNTTRKNISSGTVWEKQAAYSRAVRLGTRIEVAGTTSMDGDQVVNYGDAYGQAIYIFKKIETALKEAGATFRDVIRTRMYIVNMKDAEFVLKAHAEIFKNIFPVATLVQVSSLIHPDLLIEIEVSAEISE